MAYQSESFMDNATWVDELKLRVNYGVAGNQLSASYPYTNLWTIGGNQRPDRHYASQHG